MNLQTYWQAFYEWVWHHVQCSLKSLSQHDLQCPHLNRVTPSTSGWEEDTVRKVVAYTVLGDLRCCLRFGRCNYHYDAAGD